MKIDPLKLRQVSVFQNATDEDLKLIAGQGIERSIEEGEFFFFQGDPADYLYVLISGRAKLMQTNPAGQQVNLRTISDWQMFGALGAVREGATYPASAQALDNSTALAIKSEYLQELMQTRPYLSFDLMKLMTSYIQEMQERYRELATEKVERRIARALLRLAAQMGTKNVGGIELTFTRQDLAEMSGTTLYTVSRVLSDWERQGLVEAGRERVLIRNPHGVVSIAEELRE
ncbi:MAG: Crp/Fnr family transcriptional regulator [Bacteroidota bacterium]